MGDQVVTEMFDISTIPNKQLMLLVDLVSPRMVFDQEIGDETYSYATILESLIEDMIPTAAARHRDLHRKFNDEEQFAWFYEKLIDTLKRGKYTPMFVIPEGQGRGRIEIQLSPKVIKMHPGIEDLGDTEVRVEVKLVDILEEIYNNFGKLFPERMSSAKFYLEL
ncbi:MAG: hypothetical protein D6698_11945 [Gammaproteobacteria bacterium]|nr:MAG: hypothetical protein D6698_11945 [Gammaproteobacteria bacterium]